MMTVQEANRAIKSAKPVTLQERGSALVFQDTIVGRDRRHVNLASGAKIDRDNLTLISSDRLYVDIGITRPTSEEPF